MSPSRMKLLVTGGAGYVGSVCAAVLLEQGHEVVIVDDLSTGNADAVPLGAQFVDDDMISAARTLLGDGSFDGVLHFAAKSDRKSTRLNSSHIQKSRMPSSA